MSDDLLRTCVSAVVQRLSRSHIAGPKLEDALEVCAGIQRSGLRTTLSYWSGPADEPATVNTAVLRALQGIALTRTQSRLSVKPQNHAYDIGYFSELCATARGSSVEICFDATSPGTATMSAKLVEILRRDFHNLVWTIPARWERSREDIRKAKEMNISVRLVKGQWVDPANPNRDAAQEFRALAGFCADSAIKVTVATHESRLANVALSILHEGEVICELEQMMGLPFVTRTSPPAEDVPVRVYVPYGHPWLPYNLSLIKSRPAMLTWALRDAFVSRTKKLRTLGLKQETKVA